jgi:Retrotransposon gag protein
MSSDDDERPSNQLLQPLSRFQPPQSNVTAGSMESQLSMSYKPYKLNFANREVEIQYTQKLKTNCVTYNGDPAQLSTWLRDVGSFIDRENYPETDHPFIIRHLLVDDALDYYLAHEDLIFNFYDLRKLFLHKNNLLSSLRILPSLDSAPLTTLNTTPSVLTSTQLPPITTNVTGTSLTGTTVVLSQTLEDVTQNDIRKTIIEDLQRNTTKFTGDQRQDVIKWLKNIELKFETAGIPASKKFDLISQLLDKGALDWFQENKAKFDNSWLDFVILFKRTFDSPNRARLAMQKLNAYNQSSQQDIRSFCSEMRKLFEEADPQMSSTMKLELLLAKVKPSYRLDLLKQKPKDPVEFEVLAKDLENTYLVLEAIEQNSPLDTSGTFSAGSNTPSYSSSNQTPSTPYRNFKTYEHRNYSPSQYDHNISYNNTHLSPRYPVNSTSWRNSLSNRQFTKDRQSRDTYNFRNSSHQKLSAYQSHTTSPQQSSISESIPPLMPKKQETSSSTSNVPPNMSTSLVCQLCSETGHSARDCPFE